MAKGLFSKRESKRAWKFFNIFSSEKVIFPNGAWILAPISTLYVVLPYLNS